MKSIINRLKKYVVRDAQRIDDEYIGIPLDIAALFDFESFSVISGTLGTPVIVYVINANINRIGTLSDERIIEGMLKRGFVVTVLDYLGNEKACTPAIDWSVQKVRNRIINGDFFSDIPSFPSGKYSETLVVPSGYDVHYNNVFWSIDKHGADGTLEKIVEIWNNDFRGTKKDCLLKWVDESGSRKPTQEAHDGASPVWYDKDGNENDSGEYTRVKYTKAEKITDCVKPDGSPIEMDLHMHVIYPTAPLEKVPVMCLASSAEDLCLCSSKSDRPHLNGYLFRGYAGVLFDYGYTPMARNDHYGYFDGFPKAGYITGDNPTYSIQLYNDKIINSAAMRYLRYLAASDSRFLFDTDAIGVFGNSKGGWMTFLGEKNPELMRSLRMFKNHHGETRYDNGDTADNGIIRGGEIQPWLEYAGVPLSSEADFIYSGCGGNGDAITEGHKPMFISCNRTDGSCYSTSNAFVNACRINNVPAMWLEIPSGHTLTYGNDLKFGADTYDAMFDFSGYYLKGDNLKVIGAVSNKGVFPFGVTVRFSGGVDANEIEKIKVLNAEGNLVEGVWNGSYGDIEWVFTKNLSKSSAKYSILIPDDLMGKNGKKINSSYSFEFDAPVENCEKLKYDKLNGNITFSVKRAASLNKHYIAFEIKNDGINTVGLYEGSGKLISKINTSGCGNYKIDISDYLHSLPEGESEYLTLKEERCAENLTVFENALCADMRGITVCKNARCALGKSPDGTPSLELKGFETIKDYPTEEFYSHPANVLKCSSIIKDWPVTESDMGRKFRINMRIFDTTSRYLKVELNHCTSRNESIADYRRSLYNVITKAGEWTDITFDYTVYELMYGSFGSQVKELILSCYGNGNLDAPLYVSDLKAVELVTKLEFGEICIFSTSDNESYLPEGKSEIVCHKEPWVKK